MRGMGDKGKGCGVRDAADGVRDGRLGAEAEGCGVRDQGWGMQG